MKSKVQLYIALTHGDVTSLLPRKQRTLFAFRFRGLTASFKILSKQRQTKIPVGFSHVFFFLSSSSVPPFSSFSITLNFYLHLLPHSTHSFSHTQLRERGLCVLETKAPLSLEWDPSFRLKLTVSEGRGRADDEPRIPNVVKCVCVNSSLRLSVF